MPEKRDIGYWDHNKRAATATLDRILPRGDTEVVFQKYVNGRGASLTDDVKNVDGKLSLQYPHHRRIRLQNINEPPGYKHGINEIAAHEAFHQLVGNYSGSSRFSREDGKIIGDNMDNMLDFLRKHKNDTPYYSKKDEETAAAAYGLYDKLRRESPDPVHVENPPAVGVFQGLANRLGMGKEKSRGINEVFEDIWSGKIGRRRTSSGMAYNPKDLSHGPFRLAPAQ